MTKTYLLLIGLVAGVGIGGYFLVYRGGQSAQTSDQSAATEPLGTNHYASSTYGFSVDYPRDWQYQEVSKSSDPGRSGLLAMVVFTADGTLSDQSVTVVIGLPKESAALGSRPTTVGGRAALVYEDDNGKQTYVVAMDRYRYSLMMGSATTSEVKAAFATILNSFVMQ